MGKIEVFQKPSDQLKIEFGNVLSVPQGVLDLSWELSSDSRVPSVIKYLDWISGRYVYRFFKLLHRTKKDERKIVEIARKIEGVKETLINWNCEWRGMAGWQVEPTFYDKWYWAENFNIHCYEDSKLTLDLLSYDDSLKYCGYKLQEDLDAVEYISYYQKFPKLELLSKMGIAKAIKYYRILKLDKKSFEDIFGFSKEWVPTLKSGMSVGEIKELNNKGFTANNADRFYTCKNKFYDNSVFASIKKYINASNCGKMIDYLTALENKKSKKVACHMAYTLQENYKKDYMDYLILAKVKGKDLSDNYWLLPKELKTKHDELLEEDAERKRIQNEEERKKELIKLADIDKGIKKVIKKLKFHEIACDDIKISIASGCEEIMVNGDALNICVGRTNMGYMKNMSKGGNLILFAYAAGKVKECIEYDCVSRKIVQCRGRNNGCSEYHDQIMELLEENLVKKENSNEQSTISREDLQGSGTQENQYGPQSLPVHAGC